MDTFSQLFCDECGAANDTLASMCRVCHQSLPAQSISPIVVHTRQPVSQAVAYPDLLPAGYLLAQRYTIIDKIGEGGFGVVYRAFFGRYVKRFVAIKQINLRGLNTRQIIEATDSYNREVSLLSTLQHKNLPCIYDRFTDPEHWYLVMDYIQGETLEDYLKKAKHGLLSTKKALQIGMELCNVLGYLHSQRPPIIFRDVKPSNIMLTPRGRLYLIDFGIARHYTPGQARDTGPLGSPGYAAPEQYGTAQTTVRTDIYGLGATLQTLTTGKEPHEQAFSEEEVVSLSTTKPQRELQKLLRQMLAVRADERPSSMTQVRKQLQIIREMLLDVRVIIRWTFFCLIGLFIGSLPYSLLPLLSFFSSIPVLNYILALPLYLILMIFSGLWIPLLLTQSGLAIVFLFHRRSRLIGIGILLAMAFILLAILFGWFQPANGMYISYIMSMEKLINF